MTEPYLLVADSVYRTWETRENAANWYGRVLSPEGYPVICGHGGSMWLCEPCAQMSLAYMRVEEEWPWPKVPEVSR